VTGRVRPLDADRDAPISSEEQGLRDAFRAVIKQRERTLPTTPIQERP